MAPPSITSDKDQYLKYIGEITLNKTQMGDPSIVSTLHYFCIMTTLFSNSGLWFTSMSSCQEQKGASHPQCIQYRNIFTTSFILISSVGHLQSLFNSE